MIVLYSSTSQIRLFFAAARRFASRNSDARFILIGDGGENSQEQLLEMISQEGLSKIVQLAPMQADMSAVYSALDLVTLCGHKESEFPYCLAEAMACETICVSTRSSEMADIIGDDGVIVEGETPEVLAAGWEIATSRKSEEAGKAARRRIVALFSLSHLVIEHLKLFKELGPAAEG
jgi:glycosyltransferase involved in cell wall biosynthesis